MDQPPQRMLKPRALRSVLQEATTFGVTHTLLLTQNGTLIALTGDNDQSARVTGAIAANVWHAFEREGKAAFDTTAMNFLLLGCESGRVGVTRVAGLLLCLYAKPSVEYGLLKSKALALAKHLEEPLSSVVIGGLAVGTNLDNF